MFEKTVRQGLLIDFYGRLLTDKQLSVLASYFGDDLSLGEIAAEAGVSRAAVHDIVRRAMRALEVYEDRLGLVARHESGRRRLARLSRDIQIASQRALELGDSRLAESITEIGREFGRLWEDEESEIEPPSVEG